MAPPERLGPHAPRILALLLEGRAQPWIAAQLGLSRHTTSHYVHRLRRAHGAETVELMLAGIRDAREAVLRLRIARLEQGDRRRGLAERRAPAE